jgi:predicted nucleic acid-binding protein
MFSKSTPDILVDAGPLLAFIAQRDAYHTACVEILRSLNTNLITTLPALAEAMYFALDRYGQKAVNALWTDIFDELVLIENLQPADYPRMQVLMAKYADLPMDFADASLVAVAERLSINRVFTVDRTDFSVYKLMGRRHLTVIGP